VKASSAWLRRNPRFHRLTCALHRLGPRPLGELLIEIAEAHGIEGDVLARLELFAGLDPITVRTVEARDWPTQIFVVRPRR
jgi:hypothetical protein